MKKHILLWLIVLILGTAEAQNLSFSGGHFHSAVLCQNGTVFTFGQGTEGQLGNGTFTNTNSLTQVLDLAGTGNLQDIRQVDAGSGAFTIALSECGDTVYTWGNNNEGQLGDGTTTDSNIPVMVRGVGGAGFLSDIRFISGGNGEAYVITEDDRILSWGGNDFGQLGRGTITASEVFADYVLTGPGTPLTNVEFVDGGDDFGVALLKDGTVWFWGKDGRGAGGQGVDNADPGVGISYATQVRDAAGTGFLKNISKITAGDRHVLALSRGDTLWSWGANWGRQIGNNNGNANQPLPTPVLAVNNSGGILTDVNAIAAGNAHSVASLNDGTVVSWGLRRDGHLGDNNVGGCACGGDGSPFPVYTMNSANTAPLGNITNVSDGDNWSFALDSFGQVWLWGRNDEGQLGLGDNNDRLLAAALTIPCTISPIEQPPFANLGNDLDLCSPLTATLDAGDGGTGFTYEWFYNDVIVPSETNKTYAISQTGEYKVIITKTTQTCDGPQLEQSSDSINVTSSAAQPDHGEYCPGGAGTVGVTGPGEYKWFDAPVGGTVVGTGSTAIIPIVTGPGTVTYYAEDTAAFSSRVGPTTISTNSSNVLPWDNGSATTQNQIQFTTTTDLTIDSVTVGAFNGWDGDYAIEVSVIDVGSGTTVSSAWSPVMTGASNPTEHQVYLGLNVPAAGDYYLRFTNSTNGDDRLLEASFGDYSAADFPFTEPTGIISITEHFRDGNPDQNRYSLFWDLVVSTGSLCDRVPVNLEENCPPCASPGTVTLSPAGPIELCSTTQLLTASETGTAPVGGFEYEFFYNDGSGAVSVQGPNTTNTYTATNTGDYYVVVTDPSDAGSCNGQSANVSITIYQTPTVSVAGSNQTICADNTTMAGNTPTVGTGTWSLVSGSGSISSVNDPATAITALGIGANVFEWSISNGVCTASTSQVTITQDESPTTANAGTNTTICASTYNLSANTATVGTSTWSVITGGGLVDDVNSPTSSVSSLAIGTNTFRWTIENGVCPNSESDVTITVDEQPSTADAGTNDTLCSITSNLNAVVPSVGTGEWSVIAGGSNVTTIGSNTSGVTGLTPGDHTFEWEVSNGVCVASTDQMTIHIDESPTTANAGTNTTICAGTYNLSANTATVGTSTWSVITGGGLVDDVNSPTSSVSSLAIGTNTFRWTIENGVCPDSESDVTITVDEQPSTADAGTNDTLCSITSNLNAVAPSVGTGEWSVIAGGSNVTTIGSNNSGVTGLTPGDHTFEWEVSNGVCVASTDQMTIHIDEEPTTAVAGTQVTTCDTVISLDANTPTVGTGAWSISSGGGSVASITNPTSQFESYPAGLSTLTWTISNGVCPNSTDQVDISRDLEPTTASAGNDQSLCVDNTTLNGNIPIIGTGLWTTVSGIATIADAANAITAVTNLGGDTAVMQWAVSNGACPTSRDTMLVIYTANAPASVSINPTSPAPVCQGEAITFKAITVNGGAVPTYEWILNSSSLGVGSVDSLVLNNPNDGDAIEVIMSSSLSCATNSPATSSTVVVQIDAPVTGVDAGADQTICEDSTATLQANTPAIGSGAWTVLSGTANINPSNDPNATVTGLSMGTNELIWTVTNGTCPAVSDTMIINVDELPSAAIVGANQTICTDLTSVSATSPVVGSGTWALSTGSGSITNPNDPSTDITGLPTGTSTFTWEVSSGVCASNSATVSIEVDEEPSAAQTGADQNLCSDASTLSATVPAIGTGTWTMLTGGGVVDDVNGNPTAVTGLSIGSNTFEWSVANGTCPESKDTIELSRTGSAPASVSLNPGTPAPVCVGNDLMFTAIPVNEGVTPSYDWFLNNTLNTTSTVPTQLFSGLTNGDVVHVVMTSSLACATGSPATSSPVAITIDLNPTAANAGTDDTICATVYTLGGNLATIGNGEWSVLSGVGVFDNNANSSATVSGLSTGSTELLWTIRNGTCDPSVDTVVVNVAGQITQSDAGQDQVVCETQNVSVQANAPGFGETGLWSTSGDGTFTSNSSSSTIYTPGTIDLSSLSAVLTWTLDNGVCPSNASSLSVSIDQEPSQALAGVDSSICFDNITLYATAPSVGSGLWTINTGTASIANDGSYNSALTGITSQVNLTWTVSNGQCPSSSDNVAITNLGSTSPTISISSDAFPLCEGTDPVFTASVFGQGNNPDYEWYIDGVAQTVNQTTFQPSTLTGGELIHASLNSSVSCATPSSVESNRITPEFMAKPAVVLSTLLIDVCETDPRTLAIDSYQDINNTFTWLRNDIEEVGLRNELAITMNQASSSGDWVVIEDNGVCPPDTSSAANVTVYTMPTVNAGTQTTFECGKDVELNGSVSAGTFEWDYAEYLSDTQILNPIVGETPESPWVFTLSAVNGACSVSDSVSILISGDLNVPDVITPNGDNVNDVWNIEGIETYQNAHVMIFNRWGNMLYETYKMTEGWDGNRNGKMLPVATYYYVIETNNGCEPQKGPLTIMR